MNHEQLHRIHQDLSYTQSEKVEASIKAFQHYMNTYTYETCGGNAEVFMSDVLYMLGVALDPEKYRFGDGFTRFKGDLLECIPKRTIPKCSFTGDK